MPLPDELQRLSVVAPAHNEADNLDALIREIVAALDRHAAPYEIVIVDDGSTDATPDVLRRLQQEFPALRVIRMLSTPPGLGNGQSAAFHAGFRACRGDIIATLDADLQNDPADIPGMLECLAATGADMIQGDRTALRRHHDGLVRIVTARVGLAFRRWLLGDTIIDTGCSLRVMKREVALAIPLEFRGMHRFIPITAHDLGYTVIETPVRHRPRVAGSTKYGIWNRALPGLIDCLAVRWMRNRRTPVRYESIELPESSRTITIQTEAPTRQHQKVAS